MTSKKLYILLFLVLSIFLGAKTANSELPVLSILIYFVGIIIYLFQVFKILTANLKKSYIFLILGTSYFITTTVIEFKSNPGMYLFYLYFLFFLLIRPGEKFHKFTGLLVLIFVPLLMLANFSDTAETFAIFALAVLIFWTLQESLKLRNESIN